MKICTRNIALLCVLLVLSSKVFGQARIRATITSSAQQMALGDTLSLSVFVEDSVWRKKAISLNVWIEDIRHTSRWQLRYPVLAGQSEADVVFPKGLNSDFYAIHCSIQPVFFDLTGTINGKFKGDSISFTMIDYKRNLTFGSIPIHFGNQFRLGKVLFEQTSHIFFSEHGKRNKKLSNIKVVAPLDSSFVPLYDTTLMVQVGKRGDAAEAAAYTFNKDAFINPGGTLENVTVTAERRSKVELLEEEYVRNGLFSGGGAMSFDGDDPVLRSSFDALNFLRGRVPGLNIATDADGLPSLTWRGAATALYIDEMLSDAGMLSIIPTTDIALIKVFRPPFFGAFGGGPGGAIAIYTRRGVSIGENPTGGIVLNGYTPMLYTLPIRD